MRAEISLTLFANSALDRRCPWWDAATTTTGCCCCCVARKLPAVTKTLAGAGGDRIVGSSLDAMTARREDAARTPAGAPTWRANRGGGDVIGCCEDRATFMTVQFWTCWDEPPGTLRRLEVDSDADEDEDADAAPPRSSDSVVGVEPVSWTSELPSERVPAVAARRMRRLSRSEAGRPRRNVPGGACGCC